MGIPLDNLAVSDIGGGGSVSWLLLPIDGEAKKVARSHSDVRFILGDFIVRAERSERELCQEIFKNMSVRVSVRPSVCLSRYSRYFKT